MSRSRKETCEFGHSGYMRHLDDYSRRRNGIQSEARITAVFAVVLALTVTVACDDSPEQSVELEADVGYLDVGVVDATAGCAPGEVSLYVSGVESRCVRVEDSCSARVDRNCPPAARTAVSRRPASRGPQPVGQYPGYSHHRLCTPASWSAGHIGPLALASIPDDPLRDVPVVVPASSLPVDRI